MKPPKAPVHKIRPDVEYMPPEDYEQPELKILFTKDERIEFCPHEQIRIFPHHRIIQCAHCSATLDPFDHLVAVGRQENNQLSHIKYLKVQVKRYTEELEKLQAEVKKVKKEINTKP